MSPALRRHLARMTPEERVEFLRRLESQRQPQQQRNPLLDAYLVSKLGGSSSLPGISGASVSGANAGLGGAGAGSWVAANPFLASLGAAFGPAIIGSALNDGGNLPNFISAVRGMQAGQGETLPLGVQMLTRGGATFLGGDPNALDRIYEQNQDIGTYIAPGLISLRANPENTRRRARNAAASKDKYKDSDNRFAARAADNASKYGYKVTPKQITTSQGRVRKAYQPKMIERRRLQGGR